MFTRKQFTVTTLGFLLTGSLAACGGAASPDDKNATDGASSAADSAAAKTLVVAASPSPHAKILQDFAAPRLEKEGITLEVREYPDYDQPNVATTKGEVDANYFQHVNYLNNYNKQNGTNLASAGAIHYEPFGVYSSRHEDLASIEDGAKIAIPNDPTNEGRALLVLQQEGLITLKDPQSLEATPADVDENVHGIEFQELEASALPRTLDDVDYAVINGNYAIEAGLHVADAVAVEANSGKAVEQYANIICTTPDKVGDERVVALVGALKSKDFVEYLKKTYNEDVLPAE